MTCKPVYPFVAIVGQEKMKLALYLNIINMMKAAKALAAFEGKDRVEMSHVEAVAELALPHRMRRSPLMEAADNLDKIREARRKKE